MSRMIAISTMMPGITSAASMLASNLRRLRPLFPDFGSATLPRARRVSHVRGYGEIEPEKVSHPSARPV
jgi:hypothetical protein